MKKKGKEEDWQKANGSWRVRMREDPRESQEGRITLLTSVCSKSGIPTGLQFPCIPVMTQLHNSQLLNFSRLLRKLFCIGEGNGNPLQRSCLENPGYRGAWWAAVSGVAQSQTGLKRLSRYRPWTNGNIWTVSWTQDEFVLEYKSSTYGSFLFSSPDSFL